jgi:hypothetical protein
MPASQWYAIRNEAGLKINPETADVDWSYGQVCDPYGVHPDLPEEAYCVGPMYFARDPGSDIWVCFYDLPEDTREKLRKRAMARPGTDDVGDLPPWLVY